MTPPPVRERLALGQCVRSTPRVVWAVTVLFAALMALYSVGVPTYHGPDETKHVDMLFAVREPGGWPAAYERRMNAQVVASSRTAGYAPGRPPRAADETVPRPQRPSFAELAPDEASTVNNHMWQHPPLGYLTVSTVLGVITAVAPPVAGWASDQVVGLARLIAMLLVAPLPLLAFWTTRRLAGRDRPAAAAAAAVTVAVPGLAHLGAAVTNDGLLIAVVGLLTVPLVYAATGDLSTRTAVLAGVVGGLALLTKGFGLVVLVWMALTYGLAALRAGRAQWLMPATAGALALLVTVAVGGWWWLRNLLVLGVVQPHGHTFPAAPADFDPSFGEWLRGIMAVTPRTFWGHFGWVEAPLPWPAVWAATGVLTAAVVLAFVARQRTGPWTRAHLGVLLAPLAGTAALMLYGSWTFYSEAGMRVALHGRYVMPGMVGLAAVAGLGLAAALPRRWSTGWPPAAVLAGAAALHGTGFAVILDRYWMEEGTGYADGLATALAWSPWPPAVVAAAAAVAAAALLWALLELLVIGRDRRPSGRHPHGPGGDATPAWTRSPAPTSLQD